MKVSTNIKGLESAVRRVKSTALAAKTISKALTAAGRDVASLAARRLSDRQIPNRVSTGLLARSINVESRGTNEVSVGTNLRYAAIQNYGKAEQVSSRPDGLLAIPVDPRLRRAGTWPRDLPRGALTFIPLRNRGNLKGVLVFKETAKEREAVEKRKARRTARTEKRKARKAGVEDG